MSGSGNNVAGSSGKKTVQNVSYGKDCEPMWSRDLETVQVLIDVIKFLN